MGVELKMYVGVAMLAMVQNMELAEAVEDGVCLTLPLLLYRIKLGHLWHSTMGASSG